MIVRPATIQEIKDWWDNRITKSPNDNSWVVWKSNFVDGNLSGKRKTFFAYNDNGEYIGQCTLVFECEDPIMAGNGKAELVKLEILKEYRGKGIATKIYNAVKDYAKCNGIKTLTLGVEPCEVHNMQVYFHWGFTNFLQCVTEEFPPVNENVPGEVITVLCYSQDI